MAKKDYFLPLLPASNSISRLIEARQTVEDITFPYEALEQQPKGWVFSNSRLIQADFVPVSRQP